MSVMRVGHVAGGKYAGKGSARCAVDGLDVTRLVGFQPRLEHIAVGLVAYSEEETVDNVLEVLKAEFETE